MPDSTPRGLAAIVSAELAGHSRLVEAAEDGTLAALKAHRNAADAIVFNAGGHIVKTTGDARE